MHSDDNEETMYDPHRRPRRTTAALIGVALLLAGCGFRPLYGQASREDASAGSPAVASELSQIAIPPIPDRSGQLLRNQLERLLQSTTDAGSSRYTLALDLSERENTFALERTGFATRANIEILARYTLIETATGKAVFNGTSRAVSGYNLLDNDFSTVVAKEDARARVLDQLALEIRNRLAVRFSREAPVPAGT